MPETPEELFARASAAADADGRLPMPPVEEWDTFPFDGEIVVRRLQPPAAGERVRHGEAPGAECRACTAVTTEAIWSDDDWALVPVREHGLPAVILLEPREHVDFSELPARLAAQLGPMLLRVERALMQIPDIGRVHIGKWGEGSYHAHIWFFARPARMPQLEGSFALVWYDILPPLPPELLAENHGIVARAMAADGGVAHL